MRRFLFVSLLVGCASTPGPNAGPDRNLLRGPCAAPSEQTFGQAPAIARPRR
ncbi:MAG: hypothetical protein R3B99_13310 [Polyangiales bacterium]